MATEEIEPDVQTLADLPFHVMGRFANPLALGRCRGGEVSGHSSKELFERVRDVSLGLGALGVSAGDRVAIVSESRPEWVVSDLAVLAAGAVTVPIYPTLSAAQARYILQDCSARIAIVSTQQQLDKIQDIRHLLPGLEAVVIMEPAAAHASVMSLDAVAIRGHARMTGEWGAGKAFRDRATGVRPADLATIIYTSGTTGEPKGVMLTHANLVANLRAAARALDVSEQDVALSFLPLSHSLERMVIFVYLLVGIRTVFAESIDTVARDIGVVRPTLLTGVPRVYEKMHQRILEKGRATPGLKGRLFDWAIRVAAARGRAKLRGRMIGPVLAAESALADRLVFSKIRDGLGGRLRFAVSGSAPLSPAIAEFFQGFGVPLIEGYGLTETAPILTVNPLDAPRAGTVGRALPGVELRIAPDGEILARGPNVMTGYYNKPEATAEVMRDGWFHTGDVGSIDAAGYLAITDRKKDVLVTSGGKKIAPQPLEAILKRSPLVSEAIIIGDRRRYASALIVPNFASLERRLRDLGWPPADTSTAEGRAALIARGDVGALYDEIVQALNHDLAQFERIKRIALLPAEFSIESGELTPTLKVRRKVVEQRWKTQIEGLYAD